MWRDLARVGYSAHASGSFTLVTFLLTGVIQNSTGSLTVDFNNTPSVFTVFVDGNAIGTFSVIVDDLVIQPGQPANIVGTISQTSEVPEPATLLMLSTGLAGVVAAVRKRWKGV